MTTGESTTWVEIRALGASREALLRAALDLLTVRGATLLRATPFEPPEPAELGAPAPARCVVEVRAASLSEHLEAVRAALEDRVAFTPSCAAPPAAGDVAPLLAGFATEAIDHTADEAFAVVACDRADLLAAAAEALGALIVRPAGVRAERVLPVAAPAPEPAWADDDRLFAWLAEVLYVLDSARFALRRAVVLDDGDGGVRGALLGEPIDEARHEVGGGIKAVTYHGMEITPAPGGGLRAQVVIDV